MADQFERVIQALGQANDRLYQLEEVDYVTAAYKGFSASGATLDEVQEEIATTRATIQKLTRRLARLEEQEK